MKTKLNVSIEIETPNRHEINENPEVGKLKGEELIKFQEDYSRDLHNEVVKLSKKHVEAMAKDGEYFQDETIDNFDDVSIEGWERFEDYGIVMSVAVEEVNSDDSSEEH